MAYAAVISLKHTIERLKINRNPSINPALIESAFEELKSLEDVLKRLDGSSSSSINRSEINALDAKIRESAYKLEDAVEAYVLHQQHHSLPLSSDNDDKGVEQSISSFNWTAYKLRMSYEWELDHPSLGEEEDHDDVALPTFNNFDGYMVGLWDQFEQIRSEVLDWQSGPKFVSLVGMAGIGKTHLARKIYQHPDIVEAFDDSTATAWVGVGPRYKMRNILVDIASQIEGKPRDVYRREDMYTLATLVQNSLRGRRYLIVLDDIWSTRVCNTLIWWLPRNENGRRIILTTRLEEVAKDHSTRIHQMRFLNNEESWKLLWQNVFANEHAISFQLERVGRKIAENCEGLPLLILAVAEILRGVEDKTEVYWNKVAEKKTSTFPDAYDRISKVLFSSYEYLPQHLKAFFLYMGVFPQSCEIHVPKLINLLGVEDFLESRKVQNLEYSAMEFLKELVSNSLAIVCEQSYNYNIKSSKLHSAYWHLCVKEARRNKFFLVLNKLTDSSEDFIANQRRLCVQNSILFGIKEVYASMAATATARSLLCTGPDHEYPVPVCFNLVLLKVLDALAVRFYEFPTEVVKLLRLRYLALTHNGELPRSISKLQQLQCLILRRHHNIKLLRQGGGSSRWTKQSYTMWEPSSSSKLKRDSTNYLPKQIWDMKGLRYLRIMGSNLPDPSYKAWLPNLLTLHVNAESCTNDVFRSIPHLKKLRINIELHPEAAETLRCFEHIRLLNRLESLKCVVVNPRLRSRVVAPPRHLSNLPRDLKKLSLNGLGYSWKYMSAIGSLPCLKVLKLRCSAFQGPEWKTVEEFEGLEFLLLEDIDLVHWTAYDGRCFPHLQHLVIRHCYKLEMIPPQLGAIPTLKTIEIVYCRPSLVASADKLRYYGNYSLQVVVNSSWNL